MLGMCKLGGQSGEHDKLLKGSAIRFIDGVTSVARHCLRWRMKGEEKNLMKRFSSSSPLIYTFLELNTFLPIKNEFFILGTSD